MDTTSTGTGVGPRGPGETVLPSRVGARLKQLRLQRRMTLTSVARLTDISKSTLSRLETGQRRPTLELLLALARTYNVPLEDLVGAPETGDPRIRLRPDRVKGRIVIPLTRQPDGMQAWKIVIPTSKVVPEPRAHDGHEWIYVLSGHIRLVLGDEDWTLAPGEVAEFDTTVPHWFGSTGHEPAEILSIFSRPGERMTVRTQAQGAQRAGTRTDSAPGSIQIVVAPNPSPSSSISSGRDKRAGTDEPT